MSFSNAKQLLTLCEEKNIKISRAMLEREMECFGQSQEDIYSRMAHSYGIMKASAKEALKGGITTMGGLIGGESAKLFQYNQEGRSACGALMGRAICYALSVLEVNASMGLIVAAPTAGSSGVLPGALLAIQEEYGFTDEKMVEALMNASAVGYLITRNATVSGAEGGCQAEVGAASAMAASAITELLGGSPESCLHAASITLANLLGLVCDPIGGLVEAPCQKRNVVGVSNALTCAQMALSGIESLVPFDEMAQVMYTVGRSLPAELRETAEGGVAAAPSACARCGKC
jgi:L-serine dehydratase